MIDNDMQNLENVGGNKCAANGMVVLVLPGRAMSLYAMFNQDKITKQCYAQMKNR